MCRTVNRSPRRAAVRAANPADADAIAEVHARAWDEAYSGLLSQQTIAAHARTAAQQWPTRLADPGHCAYWIADGGEGPVGCAWVAAVGPGHVRPLELVGLYVVDGAYGSGVADDLLTCAVGQAPCFLWTAARNERAVSFYRRHGFAADGEARQVQQWDDLEVIRMVR